MLVLRLARTGRRNQPKYRLVVAEHSKPVDGRVVEVVGHYNPTDINKPLEVNKEAVSGWLAKGVQPSNTVAKLLNRVGFDLPVHQSPVRPAKKAPKAEPIKPAIETAPATEGASADEAASESTTESVAEESVGETTPAEAAPAEEASPETEAVAEESAAESVPTAETTEEEKSE